MLRTPESRTLKIDDPKSEPSKEPRTNKNGEDDVTIGRVTDQPTTTDYDSFESLSDYYAEDLTFEGTAGRDEFVGRHGDDTMLGSPEADMFDGYYGSDTVDYSGSILGIEIDLTQDEDGYARTASGGDAEGDKLRGIENIIGTEEDDNFSGNAYDNTFEGRGGNDTFSLDAGRDTYIGGEGDDTILVEDDDVTIDLMLGLGSGGDAEGDRYESIETVVTLGQGTTVIGSNGAETVFANFDTKVELNGGADTLVLFNNFQNGADFDGGSGADTIDFSPAGGDGVTVDLGREFFDLPGGVVGIPDEGPGKVTNFENVIGTMGSDTIADNGADNTFTGSGGEDVFQFNHAGTRETDRITDFQAGVDRIDLTAIDSIDSFEELFGIPNPASPAVLLPEDASELAVETAIEALYMLRDTGLLDGVAFMEQSGSNVIVHTDFGNYNSIVLENVNVEDLTASDFLLVG